MNVILILLFLSSNSSFANDRSMTPVPTEEWYACRQSSDCMLSKQQCLRIISINKSFKSSLDTYMRSVHVGCGGSLGDAKAIETYKATCEKNRCEFSFDFDEPNKFYIEWKNKADEYLKLTNEYEKADPVQFQYDNLKKYFAESFLPYLNVFEKYQAATPNDKAMGDLFRVIAGGAGIHYEKLSEAAANVYLKNPERFARVFRKSKLSDSELFCKRTKGGLEAKKVLPEDKRLKNLSGICSEPKKE